MKTYYDHAGITIYHADCREVLPRLSGVDLAICDPPFNVGKKYGSATNDQRPTEEYWQWFSECCGSLYNSMVSGYLYAFHTDHGIFQARPALESLGFVYRQMLIWWGKNGYNASLRGKGWSYRHEPILFFSKGEPERLGNPDGGWYTTVIEAPRPQSNTKEGRYHPAQKPIRLFSVIIHRTPCELLVDPFCGSGSCLIAAKKARRRAIGIEIEEKYCEIAAKRLGQEVLALR